MSLCGASILQVMQAHEHRAYYGLNNLWVACNAYNALQDLCVEFLTLPGVLGLSTKVTQKEKWNGDKNTSSTRIS